MNATIIQFPMVNRLTIVAGQPKYTKRPAVIHLSGPKHIPVDPHTCLLCEFTISSPSARCTRCGFQPGED